MISLSQAQAASRLLLSFGVDMPDTMEDRGSASILFGEYVLA